MATTILPTFTNSSAVQSSVTETEAYIVKNQTFVIYYLLGDIIMRNDSSLKLLPLLSGLIVCGFSSFILFFYYLIVVVFRLRNSLPLNVYINVPVLPARAGSWSFFFAAWGIMLLSVLFVVLIFVGLENSPPSKRALRKTINNIAEQPKYQYGLMAALFLCAAALAITTGFRHDYVAFSLQWAAILQGADPWNLDDSIPVNAYGPLFNTLAILFAIHPLAPKLLFCVAWLGSAAYLVKVLSQRYRKSPLVMLAGVFCLFLNPFFWLTISEYGLFDILPAISCLGAIALSSRRRFYWAGFILGIGVLLKFYPIVLLPFLMVESRRLKIAPALSCIGTVGLGFLISVVVWGQSTFSPFLFAHERESKTLSIFMFLRGKISPLRLFVDQPNLDAYSTYAIVLFVGLVLILVWTRKLEISLSAIAGMLTTLAFYKVGHSQFYTSIFLMIPFWYATSRLPEPEKGKILLPFSLLLAWLVVLQLAYNLFGGMLEGPWIHLRDVVGLPTFGLECWSVISAIRYGGCLRR